MTTTSISVPTADGGSIKIPLVVAAPLAYPYPVVPFTPTAGETLPHFLSRMQTTLVDFAATPATFSDFGQGAWNNGTPSGSGGWGILPYNTRGFLNAKLSMVPMSSTKGALVNALTSGQTTNYQLVRLGNGNPGGSGNPQCFFTGELDGTPQGHQYTGMQSYATDRSIFGPFVIKAVQSNKAKSVDGPPGETFAWGSYHDTNPTFNDFEIDGRDTAGNKVTCSGIGLGPQDSTVNTFTRGYIHDVFGGGITHYLVTNSVMNFTDLHLNSGGAGLNFERCNGSTANIVRPNFDNCGVDIIADSDAGFLTINIIDPVLTASHPKVVICVHTVYDYPPRHPDTTPNKQLDPASHNHVNLIIGGVSRPDLIPSLIQFVGSY